ncbi:MAG: TonB-dependent receptor [Bacteroidota bacterium]
MKYLIIFLVITSYCLAQEFELKGKVLNKSTDQPLPSANIFVKGKSQGTAADEKGNFILKGEFSNKDTIVVSYIGFEKAELPFSQLFYGQTNYFYLESKIITSQTVLVKGSIGKTGITPISFSKLERQDIGNSYTNQDIPDFLSYTPSATFYSENGNGLGYNYLSIRGFDQRRISVSINGVPQNDPEDHNVYWIDFPDLLGSTELIQVQRGSGSGITGFAAIGGSINLITSVFSDKPHKEFSVQYGDYNTRKYSASAATGLLGGQYSFYARFSQTLSDGYRDMSWINLKSYHLSAIRYDENLTTQINLFGGPIEDGLAYTGLPKFAVNDRELRKKNYSYWEADTKEYTFTLERRDKEIENFFQPHFELLNEFRLNNNTTINSALFLVIGDGFFDYDASWADTNYFRLTKEYGFNLSNNPTNAIIRAKVENIQWGWIPRLNIKHGNGELILGGEIRIHNSNHWGKINYAENLPSDFQYDYQYYYYEGAKEILNFYVHESYQINEKINVLAETQLAYHNYKIDNEKYLNYNFNIDDLFFNPRVGINYRIDPRHSLYLSYSSVTKEPRLKNYYDAAESSGGAVPQFEVGNNLDYDFSKPLVQPETMHNIESGVSIDQDGYSASLNLYYMAFNDEIVKQGQLDRFGQPITGNMDKTIHYGVEASFNYKADKNWEIIFNGSYSKNYISSGETFIYAESSGEGEYIPLDLTDNPISGFPEMTLNTIINYHDDNLFVQLSGKYVGKFYTDNYGDKLGDYLQMYPGIADYVDNAVDPYFAANLFASYSIEVGKFVNSLKAFVQINNLFDNLYASYGIGKEFFPAAERNILLGLTIGL